ncbi:hypothetical protein [Fluviispira multicolorata]|uniref:Uncharacterized protein n=1 Tax=Fluviispira multicolorata TaxID=2654512 RepID=A0A833JE10_9BACT|nr:hypothetical protein [Fluviispira multicolorata]KAB8029690.1 hypothetical protein GCL57_09090 [Fluviispira multicolorata]
MVKKLNLSHINVYQSDKASSYLPPYETDEQKANVMQVCGNEKAKNIILLTEALKKILILIGDS